MFIVGVIVCLFISVFRNFKISVFLFLALEFLHWFYGFLTSIFPFKKKYGALKRSLCCRIFYILSFCGHILE